MHRGKKARGVLGRQEAKARGAVYVRLGTDASQPAQRQIPFRHTHQEGVSSYTCRLTKGSTREQPGSSRHAEARTQQSYHHHHHLPHPPPTPAPPIFLHCPCRSARCLWGASPCPPRAVTPPARASTTWTSYMTPTSWPARWLTTTRAESWPTQTWPSRF